MKLTDKQKYEIKSFVQTFLAVFIPLVIATVDILDFSSLSKETLTAFGIALLRAGVKALWTVLSAKLTKNASN